MTLLERKRMMVLAIRELEDRICDLKDHWPIGMSYPERDEEIERLQRHLRSGHSVLVAINEEEIREAKWLSRRKCGT